LLNVDISKKQQSSDWSNPILSNEQINYAATDVIYLHDIKNKLDEILKRQNRENLVKSCINFLPTRVELDLRGWSNDIFSHSS
jgi:ribonuclease D